MRPLPLIPKSVAVYLERKAPPTPSVGLPCHAQGSEDAAGFLSRRPAGRAYWGQAWREGAKRPASVPRGRVHGVKLEIKPDAGGSQMVRRIAEANRPGAGGSVGGIGGGTENLIGGADVQVAVLAEHLGVAGVMATRTPALACAAKVQAGESVLEKLLRSPPTDWSGGTSRRSRR